MMGTSERQLLCACLWLACRTAHVDTVVGDQICGGVLSYIRTANFSVQKR